MFKEMAARKEQEIQEFVEFTGLNTEICKFMYDLHPSLESAKESWTKVSDDVETGTALQKKLDTVPALVGDGKLAAAIRAQQEIIQYLLKKSLNE